MLSLWLRTLVDVGMTVVREHLSDPNAKMGLLEAAPNAPLPWKGVLLVLIPGLVFFVSQIEQVTSNKDWFFLIFYRGAYFLILPVLLVWLLSRRFPVWGLIPFGLLYGILRSYTPNYVLYRLFYSPQRYTTQELVVVNNLMDKGYMIVVPICAVLLGGLIWHQSRRRQISRTAWKWLGLCALLIILQVAGELYRFATFNYQYWDPLEGRQQLFQVPLWYLYDSLPFLLLIFIGVSFARKYKGLSFLLLLGYLLPTVIFGRYDPSQHAVSFYVVRLVVLAYRFIVALVAPVWLVRAASIQGRQRAAAIPVALAILCHISLIPMVYLTWASQAGYPPSLLELALALCSQLIVAAGLGLAVALYLPRQESQAIVPPPELVATE